MKEEETVDKGGNGIEEKRECLREEWEFNMRTGRD